MRTGMGLTTAGKAFSRMAGRIGVAGIGLLLLAGGALAQDAAADAEAVVRQTACLDGRSIDTVLQEKIDNRSQRDLGWQVFREGEFYEVERAFLINKSMQLRFRWRVNADRSVTPVGDRAADLCRP